MWRKLAFICIFVSGLGLLTGCGSLPKPFAHEGPVKSNPLLTLAGGGAIRVEVDASLPDSLAKPLLENMIKSLWAEHVPASAATNFQPRFVLNGQLDISYPSVSEPEEVEMIWTLSTTEGAKLGSFDRRFSGDRAGWLFLDRELLAELSSDAGKEVVRVLYGQQIFNRRALTMPPSDQPEDQTAKVEPPVENASDSVILRKTPKIFLAEVIGASGDGKISLHRNLDRFLKIAGAEIVAKRSDSTFMVKGFVNISPPYGGTNDVAITWLVATKDGKELGKINQNNKVPAGALDGRWGDLAHIIAQGASIGVIDVIEQYLVPKNRKNQLQIPG